jgi:hypothetical protein
MELSKEELGRILWLFYVAEGETQLDPEDEELKEKIVKFLEQE